MIMNETETEVFETVHHSRLTTLLLTGPIAVFTIEKATPVSRSGCLLFFLQERI
jgi:hypothetical protein